MSTMTKAGRASSTESAEVVSSRLKKKDDVSDAEAEEGEDASEEGEEEYEIESIIEAKKGYFEGGKMGYFVSWKGYGPEENSWVNEDDAGNADALIAEFWARQKKGRKVDSPAKSKPRKSAAGESASVAKKRGRKSTTGASSDGDVEMSEPLRSSKKSRKSAAEKREASTPGVDEDVVFGDMTKYRDMQDWEDLIQEIDTIEREDDQTLYVYLRLHTGERMKEKSSTCRTHCPQKLITFYEANLRWKTASENEDSA